MEDLVAAIEVNGFDPIVDRVFNFDEARQAYDYLDGASHIGKVVIKV